MITEDKINLENNTNKWNSYYEKLPDNPSAFLYGETVTYKKAADFLITCKVVEDWGCGGGGFLRFRTDAIGVDGSDTKFATKKFIDLKTYTTECDGIHLRHVLEHNYSWKDILRNALSSAKEKVVITFFIPVQDIPETVEVTYNPIGVPDLKISKKEFYDVLKEFKPTEIVKESFVTGTQYNNEEIYYITK